jgi:hypothetical protein
MTEEQMQEVDDVLREQVAGLSETQRERVRADLGRWSSLLWATHLDAPERDLEVVRASLLRVL